jgi:hypothetical protein
VRPYWKPVMFGDLAESFLRRLGITKKLVSSVVGSCGCQQRQNWLNEWGVRLQWRVYHSRAWWRDYAVSVFKLLGRLS